jgi:Tfp pilus assembly protein PilE
MKEILMNFTNTKKAAMFGLDARIALAIFGALSVISGAALYSAIKEAKITAIITQLNEVSKAVESYYIDTGEYLEVESSSTFRFKLSQLFINDNNVSNWNGPYLSIEQSTNNTNALKYSLGYDGEVVFAESGTWDSTSTAGDNTICDTGDKCSVWIGLLNIDTKLADEIDKKIDGVSDSYNGKIRRFDNGANHKVFFKSINYKQN